VKGREDNFFHGERKEKAENNTGREEGGGERIELLHFPFEGEKILKKKRGKLGILLPLNPKNLLQEGTISHHIHSWGKTRLKPYFSYHLRVRRKKRKEMARSYMG